MIFTHASQLASELTARFNGEGIIGIDGWTGAGKTKLATALAAASWGRMFDLDTALAKDQNCYVAALDMSVIRRSLGDNGLLFVSGICLRQVLEQAEVKARAYIYVKRMAVWGWADEDDLLGKIPEFPGSSGEGVRGEMRRYHNTWQPHVTAMYEFHWLS